MGGTCCNFATQLKFVFGYDDTLDIFASHAIGGIVGNLLTGLFAQASVAAFDGVTSIPGGWLDHNYKQLGIQLADSCAGFAWSFCVTVSVFILHVGRHRSDRVSIDDYSLGYAFHPWPPLAGFRTS
jgi:Amt family ammonium transporter